LSLQFFSFFTGAAGSIAMDENFLSHRNNQINSELSVHLPTAYGCASGVRVQTFPLRGRVAYFLKRALSRLIKTHSVSSKPGFIHGEGPGHFLLRMSRIATCTRIDAN
jgi:hypothetical protein